MKNDDVVLILDQDTISRTYKLGQIVEAEPDSDGKVRSVKVRYKSYQTGTKKGKSIYSGASNIIVSRSVQKLCLIVPIEESRAHENDY